MFLFNNCVINLKLWYFCDLGSNKRAWKDKGKIKISKISKELMRTIITFWRKGDIILTHPVQSPLNVYVILFLRFLRLFRMILRLIRWLLNYSPDDKPKLAWISTITRKRTSLLVYYLIVKTKQFTKTFSAKSTRRSCNTFFTNAYLIRENNSSGKSSETLYWIDKKVLVNFCQVTNFSPKRYFRLVWSDEMASIIDIL